MTASFSVALSNATASTVTVSWQTADGSATTANGDYVGGSGVLTFAPKQTKQTIDVTVNGDTKNEPDESFFVNLGNAVGATIVDGQGEGTISNDDATISVISISNGTGPESSPAVFSISLDVASGFPITVDYQTMDYTATAADNDYVPASGTVTFAPKETKKTITIQVVDDCKFEPNEEFTVILSNNTGPSSIDPIFAGESVLSIIGVGTGSSWTTTWR